MDDVLTYQQIRLLELVDGAGRQQQPYRLAGVEEADAARCEELGLICIEAGVAALTKPGRQYMIELNT